ncbi:MAG: hypothetical protein J5685_11085 [Clostridiales bacterium]|nr:hypothetical protein [Clostridiales bacterium]
MRKLLSLILIAALVFSLCSCFVSSVIPEDALVIDYSGDEDKLRDDFYDALCDMQNSVAVRGTSERFAMEDLLEMDYGAFWVKSFSMKTYGKTTVYDLEYWDISSEELLTMKQEIDDEINAIILTIPAGSTTWDKLLRVHDQLIIRIKYDKSETASHCKDCYGALVNRSATCSGYASAFYLITAKLNIPCPLVYSETHTWNKMLIASEERYIDVTWDDPDENSSGGIPYICHDYFGVTEADLENVPQHTIIRNNDSALIYDSGMVGNYHKHYNLMLSSADGTTIVNALTRQYSSGCNVLTIRFYDHGDYLATLNAWTADEGEELLQTLVSAGIRGDITLWYNDELNIINIGL